jgi:hypothetical protein
MLLVSKLRNRWGGVYRILSAVLLSLAKLRKRSRERRGARGVARAAAVTRLLACPSMSL